MPETARARASRNSLQRYLLHSPNPAGLPRSRGSLPRWPAAYVFARSKPAIVSQGKVFRFRRGPFIFAKDHAKEFYAICAVPIGGFFKGGMQRARIFLARTHQ